MAMFSNASILAEAMERELSKQEYQLEDGEMVSNLQGICQNLISRALDGDLAAISFIIDLEGKK